VGIRFGRLALAAAFVLVASAALFASSGWASPVTLNAVDRPGGAVLNEQVQWRVMRLDSQGKEAPTPAAVGSDPVLKTELKPGHYVIEAIRGTVHIKQGLVVGSGAETRNIVVSPANAAVGTLGGANATATSGVPATAVVQPMVPAKPAQTAAAQIVVKPNSKLTIGMIPNSGRGAITDPIGWQVFTYSKGVTENGKLVA
jgi:hypothetical protein